MMKSSNSAGLQAIALALIFMPEPFTTPIGLALLTYAKVMAAEKPAAPRRVINTFDDIYSYRLQMQRNSTISYELSARRYGQLPGTYPRISRPQDNPEFLKAVRARTKAPPQPTSIPFSKLEPAGLMRGPRIKDRAALALPSKVANPKFSSIIT
jgi:hypothetical protein